MFAWPPSCCIRVPSNSCSFSYGAVRNALKKASPSLLSGSTHPLRRDSGGPFRSRPAAGASRDARGMRNRDRTRSKSRPGPSTQTNQKNSLKTRRTYVEAGPELSGGFSMQVLLAVRSGFRGLRSRAPEYRSNIYNIKITLPGTNTRVNSFRYLLYSEGCRHSLCDRSQGLSFAGTG